MFLHHVSMWVMQSGQVHLFHQFKVIVAGFIAEREERTIPGYQRNAATNW